MNDSATSALSCRFNRSTQIVAGSLYGFVHAVDEETHPGLLQLVLITDPVVEVAGIGMATCLTEETTAREYAGPRHNAGVHCLGDTENIAASIAYGSETLIEAIQHGTGRLGTGDHLVVVATKLKHAVAP